MALSLLTDEQISPLVAEQVRAKRPEIPIASVSTWRAGALLGALDDHLLRAAAEDGLTLVTYDRVSIPPLLTEWGSNGEEHAGVIFIDERTIAQADLGGQVLALIAHRDQTHDWEWRNVIAFLRAAR